jgi:uncharacterized protein YkwD
MASLARILGAVAMIASLAVLAAHHPPAWVRAHVDAARADLDPWSAYVAPESSCPGRDRTDLDVVAQDRVMVCLLSYARGAAGLKPLRVVYRLNLSSLHKAMDIVRCSDFSHTACGRPFPAVFEAVGYTGRTGENIAWGSGSAGSPATVVSGWLNSPHHRENLFSREWSEQGIALVPAASFLGERQAEIWVNEFGNPA